LATNSKNLPVNGKVICVLLLNFSGLWFFNFVWLLYLSGQKQLNDENPEE